MRCSEVMRGNVETCRYDDTVSLVAAKMRDRNVGFVPVCNATGQVVGIVTDRDIAVRAVAERLPGDGTIVEEVMTREVVSCRPTDDLETAKRLMAQRRKSRIVCLDDEAQPVGVI